MSPAPKEPQVARVRPVPGEIGRFQVQSQSAPAQWHLVDLCAYDGAGECDCIRFSTVCWPIIRDTKKLPPSKRCRHIRASREVCLNAIISAHIKK